MTRDPFDQLLRNLTLERHNGGGWRPTTPKPVDPDPDAERHRQVLADYVTQSSTGPVDRGLGLGDSSCHLGSVATELIKRTA